MISLKDFIEDKLYLADFEKYLNERHIDIPTIADEKSFIYDKMIDKYGELSFYRKIYERLGDSYSYEKMKEYLEDEFNRDEIWDIVTENEKRKENISLTFKTKVSSLHDDHFRKRLNQTLDFANWFIYRKIRATRDDLTGKTYKVTIEPAKPNNVNKFIYEECHGILYRVHYQSNDHTTEKIDKIFRIGLNPKVYKFTDTKRKDYKTYFIANTTEENVIKDLVTLINEVEDYYKHKNELIILKIDLNKFKKEHGRNIQCLVDPRMDLTCYWTSEFISASCIEDVTEEYQKYYL